MKIFCKVNLVEAVRRGINVPHSYDWVEIDPAKLSRKHRALLSDLLDGRGDCIAYTGVQIVCPTQNGLEEALDDYLQNQAAIVESCMRCNRLEGE